MTNLLLDLLTPEDQERFLQDCELVELEQRQVLIEIDEPIEDIYFPTSGVISHLVGLSDGNFIECRLVGNDGFAGLSAYHGAALSPTRFVVHVPGEAWHIGRTGLRSWVSQLPRLQILLSRYNDFLLAVAAQCAAVISSTPSQRCAAGSYASMTGLKGTSFPLTQEFLAQMLGVRRASVSLSAVSSRKQASSVTAMAGWRSSTGLAWRRWPVNARPL